MSGGWLPGQVRLSQMAFGMRGLRDAGYETAGAYTGYTGTANSNRSHTSGAAGPARGSAPSTMAAGEEYELTEAQEYRLLLLFVRADTSRAGRLDLQLFEELCE